jgi:hypothetical protein
MTLRVECGEALLAGAALHPVEIGGGLLWSETLASGQTTAQAAPPATQPHRAVVFTLVPEANGWASIGPAPDATNAALRRRMLSGVPRSFLAPAGARVAWVIG